jgi:TolA-binding protein
MTGKLSGGERRCPDDLVVRGQRGHLSELERHALAAHLSQCADCRAASALAGLFDAVPDGHPGDADLIARVADQAIRSPHRFKSGAGLRVAAVVALVVLTCGGATAAWMAYRQLPSVGKQVAAPAAKHKMSGRTARVLPLVRPAEAPAVPSDETPGAPSDQAQTAAEPQHKRRAQLPAVPAPAAAPVEPTAASLFADANAVRRGGDIRKAVALYQSLRQRFPESSQAMLSAISVGDLLLGEGDAAGAVAAYASYLRSSPKGALTEEALFGRARGLRMLGRNAEERQTWQELVRRFPRSAYQPIGSRRLRELAP